MEDRPRTVHLTVLEALREHRRLLLIGRPGAGKTSLLTYVAAAVASEPARIALGLEDVRLPIFVRLRETGHSGITPAALLRCSLPRELANDFPADFLESYLAHGRCLLLFDGLDELTSADRSRITDDIVLLANSYPANRFVVTSRPLDTYGSTLSQFTVLQMARPSVDDLVHAISEVYLREEIADGDTPGDVEETAARVRARRHAQELTTLLRSNDALLALVADPFWLHLAVELYKHTNAIPYHRTQLLEHYCDHLLNYWDTSRSVTDQVDGSTKVRLLSATAHWLQSRQEVWAARDEIITVFRAVLDASGQPEELAQELLTALSRRSSVLVERGTDIYGFSHRIFQEYFAARYLADVAPRDSEFIRLVEHEPAWLEVLEFYREIMDRRPGGEVVTT